ncbi:MAG: aspartate kinase [Pleomorphochaeta sp.]
MIVCKFGGSSVASAKQLEKVKSIVESNLDRQIVVVSAPGKRDSSDIKVTDLLYSCCKEVKETGNCDKSFTQIEKRFIEILEDFNLDTSIMKKALSEIKEEITLNANENYAASRGEYLNAIVISQYFGYEFVDAAELIVINDNGYVADETWDKITKKLDSTKKYIIPGFYGVNKSGIITTFSRGGSDITGAIISKAMNASVYENWTDVAGCYNVDPRFIKKAYPIETMTYSEVRELSAFGASVFHADAIAPVMEAGIPINIKNTNDPEANGTMIVSSKDNSGPIGVSKVSSFSKFLGKKLMLYKESGMINTLHAVLKSYGITPNFAVQGVDSFSFLFDSELISGKILNDIKVRFKEDFDISEIDILNSLSVVGVVGQDINNDIDCISKCFEALKENNITVHQSVLGASSLSVYFVVDDDKASKAVEVIFDKLF